MKKVISKKDYICRESALLRDIANSKNRVDKAHYTQLLEIHREKYTYLGRGGERLL